MRRWDRLYHLAVCLLSAALAVIIWYDVSHQSRELVIWQAESAAVSKEELALRSRMRSVYKEYSLRFKEALPGIVFWGDSYVSGSGKRDLAYQVNRQLENRLLEDINYYLTRGIRNFNFHSFRVAMIRRGSAVEDFDTITARAGVGKIGLAEDMVLPERTDPVTVMLVNEAGRKLVFGARADRRYRMAWMGDLEGYLYDMTVTPEGIISKLAFGRRITGEAAETFPAGTQVTLEDTLLYQDTPTILFFGEMENLDSPEEIRWFVRRQKEIIDARNVKENEYVVAGNCEDGSLLDKELQKTFGDHYLRVSLPEMEDTAPEDFERLGAGIYEKLDEAGCFDEAKEVAARCREEMEKSYSSG